MAKHKSKWEVYRDSIGEYRFRLVAGNGEIVLDSEGYTLEHDAVDTVIRICEIIRDHYIEMLQSDPQQIVQMIKAPVDGDVPEV